MFNSAYEAAHHEELDMLWAKIKESRILGSDGTYFSKFIQVKRLQFKRDTNSQNSHYWK